MNQLTTPVVRDVVLVGGGHSHALFMRKWAMQPLPGVRLTLVSQRVLTPYSGMLPGLVAGHYSVPQVHLDLAQLCVWANVRFIEATVTGIDLQNKTLALHDNRPPVGFDVLSLDTGSTPDLSVAGAAEFSVPVKPVHNFYERWVALQQRVLTGQDNVSLGVVGSGAGGFELIMSMRHALPKQVAQCHWFLRRNKPLKGRPEKVGLKALAAAERAGVTVHTGFDVVEVTADKVVAADGREVALNEVVWCAAARAPDWPSAAGLQVDRRGFVATSSTLQSLSHPFVFATGDIGTQIETPSDKAGVFAVRQAPFLFDNVRALLLGKPLKPYKPQSDFLSLMATGEKSAIASRGPLVLEGAWVWRWKHHIDKTFMDLFHQLPKKRMPAGALQVPQALLEGTQLRVQDIDGTHMRCSGCGAKVASTVLDDVLQQLQPISRDGVLQGVAASKDVAIIDANQHLVVQSVDQISAICDDPYVFGRIAALHALSDVVTEFTELHSAQVLVTLPFSSETVMQRDLHQVMAGVVDALNEEGCAVVGGHSSEGAQLQLGLVVNALKTKDAHQTKPASAEGDQLILTKPIGSGVLFAALMHAKPCGVEAHAALQSMLQSNSEAARILLKHGAADITDVTGFGLLGHAHRFLGNSQLSVCIQAAAVPLYEGAQAWAEAGVASSLLANNQQVLAHFDITSSITEAQRNLLCDPQTSGGLLAVVPQAQAEAAVAELRESGYLKAARVGELAKGQRSALN